MPLSVESVLLDLDPILFPVCMPTGSQPFLALLQLFQQPKVTWDFRAHVGGLVGVGGDQNCSLECSGRVDGMSTTGSAVVHEEITSCECFKDGRVSWPVFGGVSFLAPPRCKARRRLQGCLARREGNQLSPSSLSLVEPVTALHLGDSTSGRLMRTRDSTVSPMRSRRVLGHRCPEQ